MAIQSTSSGDIKTMQYRIHIRGVSPLIMHCAARSMDARSAANQEKAAIAKKKGSNRTESDDIRLRELETVTSLYLNGEGTPTIPASAIRAVIENGARKVKQGPNVREGMVVASIDEFIYDAKNMGTTAEELAKTAQFTTDVVVQRSRILRTRAKFDEWECKFTLDTDPELVDSQMLDDWLDLAGRRVGLLDWRPQKSGHYGRFETVSITSLE